MSPTLREIHLSEYMLNSTLGRSTHLVQSFSVVFLYWFYVFSELVLRSSTCALPNLCFATKK
ncbi:hypothetical protein BHE74_00017974 [Ensete ventricosum]|uniref:Uncharacterized protein n=1 Tax=Ensete ventricosum TaxID=4639 RepID=A0A427A308_ENSVE|nr:hypothetical protein B296_00017743 [Ensete ventricosum]RWW11890.1 hypothetical protein GW17_00024470 [Ensete ventricosum]RWW74101.1 hypothetical protein BHE74_00017974 [Ensete ventricosum]RZR97050.1 hypothetical protein BHM03_00026165 [Ensete ventricosum]